MCSICIMKTPKGKDTSGKGTTRRKDKEGWKLVGERIRMIRKSKNLSQEALAGLSGIATSQIGRMERGDVNATLSSVFAISRALQIEVSELFTFMLDKDETK